MLEFQKIKNEDLKKINGYLLTQKYRVCNYTIGAIYMWKDYFKNEYAIIHDMVIFKGECQNGNPTFSIPIGEGDFDKALDEIDIYTKHYNIPLIFASIPGCLIDRLKKRYILSEKDMCNWFDYVYTICDLAYLRGTKFSGQRNHVNRFKKTYLNYKYQIVTENDIDRLLAFLNDYPEKDSQEALYELESCKKLISNFKLLDQIGGYLEVDGKIVAIAIGEIIKDTLYVHVEKALREYNGSFAMINSEFVRNNLKAELKYVNREEDMGNPGLRKAKESYHPVMLLHKYTIKVIQKNML